MISIALSAAPGQAENLPRMLAYSAAPTPYFDDHAADAARIYDGMFFIAGSWDDTARAHLAPGDGWREAVTENVQHLREAGATESFLGVYFSDSGAWPAPQVLIGDAARENMAAQFGAIARAAREMGFRGICVDVEYPYPRYALDNPVWKYDGYTAEDLLAAARAQGRAAVLAMLDAFPEAPIMTLPGALWCRPIAREFLLGMLAAMAERDAPGGFHLGLERSYCLLDPMSQVAIPRAGDCEIHALVRDPKTIDYWRRRCTVAPGVWPFHQIETGGPDYPVRPWPEEMAELRQQMRTLRAVAKRYIWSFTAHPVWHPYSPEVAEKYGLGKNAFPDAANVVAQWHDILAEKKTTDDPRLLELIREVKRFDAGELTPAALCARFGTPPEWLMLGLLDNPFVRGAYSAPHAFLAPARPGDPVVGRDGLCRWFVFRNYDPVGNVRMAAAFDWMRTDKASAQLVCTITAPKETPAVLHWNWDDGTVAYLNGRVVADHKEYPENGHGLLFRDRYDFEETVPVVLPAGQSTLAVTSINSHGVWGLNLRFTDADGWPIPELAFGLPAAE